MNRIVDGGNCKTGGIGKATALGKCVDEPDAVFHSDVMPAVFALRTSLQQRVSYLDPPVRLDQLNQVAQRCLLAVRLLR